MWWLNIGNYESSIRPPASTVLRTSYFFPIECEAALKGSVMLFGRINSLNAVSWVKGEVQILMLYWHQTFLSISYYEPITYQTLNASLVTETT